MEQPTCKSKHAICGPEKNADFLVEKFKFALSVAFAWQAETSRGVANHFYRAAFFLHGAWQKRPVPGLDGFFVSERIKNFPPTVSASHIKNSEKPVLHTPQSRLHQGGQAKDRKASHLCLLLVRLSQGRTDLWPPRTGAARTLCLAGTLRLPKS